MMTPNLSTQNPMRSTLGQLDSPRNLAPTRLSLSVAPHSRGLRLKLRVVPAPEPHISRASRHGIRFALCSVRSTLLRASRLISFPPGTKIFQFPGFLLLTE